jgi:para-nitrobenzyl esterase
MVRYRSSALIVAFLSFTLVLLGTAQAQSPHTTAGLAGTAWQLVKFQGSNDTTLTPDDRAKYTLSFSSDGRVSVRFDCNRGRGPWKSAGPNQLTFGPLALTRAKCPPGSLHDKMVKDWQFVRSYIIKDGHLFLSLMADGGIYEFEPWEAGPAAGPRQPGGNPAGSAGK